MLDEIAEAASGDSKSRLESRGEQIPPRPARLRTASAGCANQTSDGEQARVAEVGGKVGAARGRDAQGQEQDPGRRVVQSERDGCEEKRQHLDASPPDAGLCAKRGLEKREGSESSGEEECRELPPKVPLQKPTRVKENYDCGGVQEGRSTESYSKGAGREEEEVQMSLVQRLALRKREAQENNHNVELEARASEARSPLSHTPEALRKLTLQSDFIDADPAPIIGSDGGRKGKEREAKPKTGLAPGDQTDEGGRQEVDEGDSSEDALADTCNFSSPKALIEAPRAVSVNGHVSLGPSEDLPPSVSVGSISGQKTASIRSLSSAFKPIRAAPRDPNGLLSPMTLLTPPLPLEPHVTRLRSTTLSSHASGARDSLRAFDRGMGGGSQESSVKALVLWSPPQHQKTSCKQLQQQLQQAVATGHSLQLTWQVRPFCSSPVCVVCITIREWGCECRRIILLFLILLCMIAMRSATSAGRSAARPAEVRSPFASHFRQS